MDTPVSIDTVRPWLAKFEWKWDGREKGWLSLREELILKADNYVYYINLRASNQWEDYSKSLLLNRAGYQVHF